MNKKICYILPEYKRDIDSHFNYLYELLERAGEDLDIFLVVEKGDKNIHLNNIKEVRVKEKRGRISRFFEGIKIVSEAHDEGCDDCYVHYSFVGALSAILVTKFKGGRVFYWNCGMPWLYKRGLFEEIVFKFILKNSILVTGTENLKKEYAFHYGLNLEKIKVLPNWINNDLVQSNSVDENIAREKLGLNKDKKIILSIQRLSERKGVDKLVPTALELLNFRKDFLFVVLGKGPYEEKLKKEILENDLDNYFKVVGTVPQKEVVKYFSASNLFFLPSEEEGFPHSLLESLATGTSFVSSDVGGVFEIIPEEGLGFLSKSRDEKEFASLINTGLDQPISSETLKNKAKNYDINVVLPQFLGLFR